MTVKNIAKTVVLNEAGEVLLLKRSATDTRRPGEWDFPGGAIEEGEDIVLAALREIDEEAGLHFELADMQLIYTATEYYDANKESVSRLLFLARLGKGQEVRLSFEHDEYRWVGVPQALELFPHPFYAWGLAYARDHGLL